MRIPIGVSDRYVVLSQADVNTLFGSNYSLTKIKNLTQPGQYLCEETLTIKTEHGIIEKVRIIGPCKKFSQVVVREGDTLNLGIDIPIREPGNLENAAPVTLVSEKCELVLSHAMIVPKRCIYMTVADAENFGLQDGQIVQVRTNGERSLIFDQVIVKVNDAYILDMCVDIDEAHAAGLKQGDWGELLLN